MSDQTSTNWRVLYWTDSRDPRSQMTVKWCDCHARNATAPQESPSESLELWIRRCLIKAVDEVVFRPLVWLVSR
jgi:hypothetical protein